MTSTEDTELLFLHRLQEELDARQKCLFNLYPTGKILANHPLKLTEHLPQKRSLEFEEEPTSENSRLPVSKSLDGTSPPYAPPAPHLLILHCLLLLHYYHHNHLQDLHCLHRNHQRDLHTPDMSQAIT